VWEAWKTGKDILIVESQLKEKLGEMKEN